MTDGMPLLNSRQMAEFVASGFLRFDAVVPDELNRAILAEIAGGLPPVTSGRPASVVYSGRPIGRLLELPAVLSAVVSMVGSDPVLDQQNLHLRAPAETAAQRLHSDGVLDVRQGQFDIQLMYYPQAVDADMGGTLLVPGSHLRKVHELDIGRYQNLRGQLRVSCPAGTILIFHHGLWHCGRPNRSPRRRYMLQIRLDPAVRQFRLWDCNDLDHPDVARTLGRKFAWYEYADGRLEIINRLRLWRSLTGDHRQDIDFWLGRMDNRPLGIEPAGQRTPDRRRRSRTLEE